MGLAINTNVGSLNAQRQLDKAGKMLSKSLERLSSGLRINSAADDAGGLVISERMGAQIRGLNQAIRNANDGISLVQTAESALQESTSIVQRMRELAVQSANESNTASDRAALQQEMGQLTAELDRIANTTQFNGANVLDGAFSGRQLQIGANAGQTISVSVADARSAALGGRLTTTGVRARANTGDTTGTVGIYEGAADAGTDVVAGDVVVNGVDIASAASGGTIALQAGAGVNSDGMKAVAARINAVVSGVTATATTSFKSTDIQAADSAAAAAGGVVAAGGIDTGANKLVINGVTIAATTVQAGDANGALAAAINAATGSTGVSASKDASGNLQLSASDGRDVVVSTTGTAGEVALGMGVGKNVTNLRIRGTLALSSKTGVTLSGATLGDAGLNSTTSVQGSNVSQLNISTASGANSALSVLDAALEDLASSRGNLGSLQNRLESTISNLSAISQNLSSARSRIVDADFAKETADMTRAQVIQQSGIAALVQANSTSQAALSLLRG